MNQNSFPRYTFSTTEMFKMLHTMSLRTRLVLLTAVSLAALLIALLSAWRTAQTSEAFASRQAETGVSNAVRELLREAREYPSGRNNAAVGGKKNPPHEREIFDRYTDPAARSAAAALHRAPETAGGLCAADGTIAVLVTAENFGADPSATEREAAAAACRQILTAPDFTVKKINVGSQIVIAAAPADFDDDTADLIAPGAISGAFAFRRLTVSGGFGDWLSLLTQGFLLLAVIGLAAFSFLTWRDWQNGMAAIETGSRLISGDLRARIVPPPLPELQKVSGSINDLAANLDENLRRRTELEQTLVKNEKLTALGRVAAGVAHEVRNPLASMKLKIQLAERGNFETNKVAATFDVLKQEIDRLDNLVKKLLDVSRPAKLNFTEFSLTELIGQRLSLISENAAGQNVSAAFDNSNEAAPIRADRERLAQIFDNLFRNALEAMPHGGALKVSLAAESDIYRVQISDEGGGFSDDERDRLFEPFFTTKDHGTGLGLTISREIAEAHGGNLHLLSGTAQGAVFTVELPIRGVVTN